MKSPQIANDQKEEAKSSFPSPYLTQEPRYSVKTIIFPCLLFKKRTKRNKAYLSKTFSMSCVNTKYAWSERFFFHYGNDFHVNITF